MEEHGLNKASTSLIRNGEDLLQFKLNLRPRREDLLVRTSGQSSSSQEEEPFSPDVSEYMPSVCQGMVNCGTVV